MHLKQLGTIGELLVRAYLTYSYWPVFNTEEDQFGIDLITLDPISKLLGQLKKTESDLISNEFEEILAESSPKPKYIQVKVNSSRVSKYKKNKELPYSFSKAHLYSQSSDYETWNVDFSNSVIKATSGQNSIPVVAKIREAIEDQKQIVYQHNGQHSQLVDGFDSNFRGKAAELLVKAFFLSLNNSLKGEGLQFDIFDVVDDIDGADLLLRVRKVEEKGKTFYVQVKYSQAGTALGREKKEHNADLMFLVQKIELNEGESQVDGLSFFYNIFSNDNSLSSLGINYKLDPSNKVCFGKYDFLLRELEEGAYVNSMSKKMMSQHTISLKAFFSNITYENNA